MFEDKQYIEQLQQEKSAIENENLRLHAQLKPLLMNESRLQVDIYV